MRRLCTRFAALTFTMLGLLVLTGAPALAAPGVVQDLPGCRTSTLQANDDDSTDTVPLGFTANIFGQPFDETYVNNNGNITFTDSLSEFTPFDFRETGDTMIAPFFADVDTRGVGSGLVHYGMVDFGGAEAFCVIWDNVGYFGSHTDKLNKFQLLLVDRGSAGVDVIFNYDTITWETGDASDGVNGFGGVAAAAGYAAGDGDSAHSLLFPGSFTSGGLLDSNPATSLAGHGTPGQPAGRWLFELRQGPPTGGTLTGIVSNMGGNPVGGVPVQMCREGGACVTRIANSSGRYTALNLPAGTYTVTAFAPSGNYTSTTVENVAVGGPGSTATQNLTLGPPPTPPPDGTEITNIGVNDDGIPVAFWTDPLELTTQGCEGATVTYQVILDGEVVRSGSLAEGPPGTYTGTVEALFPESGEGEVIIDFDCPADPDEEIDFGIYIDPSGHIRDTNGNPVEDATVILYRSATEAGPFFQVPDGSALMSPSNRRNPDSSRPDGRFGWDVVAGFYVVTAEKAGCVSAADPSRPDAITRVMTIPPPVTDLDIRLDCDGPPAVPQQPSGGGTTPPIISQTPPVVRRLATIRSARLVRGRTLVVKIGCARTARGTCSGNVKARIGKRAVGGKSFRRLRPGRSATVRIALNKRGRALVRRVKKGKRIRFALTTTIRDAGGAGATTRRTITVRR
jgi:hypothetical protein